MLLIAEAPAEPIAEICGKQSSRHWRNRPSFQETTEPHISSEMPLILVQSNACIQDYKNSRQQQEVSVSVNTPREGKNESSCFRNVSALLSTLIKYTIKGFASGREKWISKKTTVFCNACITWVLSVLTAQSQGLQLSRYMLTCWHILIGQQIISFVKKQISGRLLLLLIWNTFSAPKCSCF